MYCLREDLNKAYPGHIGAAHRWGLPGVSCPVCGQTWSNVGLAYPAIDLSAYRQKDILEDGWPVSPGEINRLEKEVREFSPEIENEPLKPGTAFGPLVGKSSGRLEGFIWNMPWTLLIDVDSLRKLESFGLSLPETVPPVLRFRGAAPELVEFQILARGRLLNGVHDGTWPRFCPGCEREGVSMPDNLIVERDSLPTGMDVFRLSNFTTVILVTERFKDAVTDSDIKGALFEEVIIV
jgi:uncharacterized double-CXXCG motif protein